MASQSWRRTRLLSAAHKLGLQKAGSASAGLGSMQPPNTWCRLGARDMANLHVITAVRWRSHEDVIVRYRRTCNHLVEIFVPA